MQQSRIIFALLCFAVMLSLGLGPAAVLAQTPAGCTELVINGGFETRDAWALGATPAPSQYVTSNPRSGAWALSQGISDGVNRQSFSSANQLITIPADAGSTLLSFWVYTIVTGATGGDYMEMALLSPDGSAVLARPWRSSGNNPAWTQLVFDLSAWRGRTFQLYSNVYNDGVGGIAQMYLDDVSLAVCPGSGGGGVILITPVVPTGAPPITPTRGACPNPVLPCNATPVATAVATPLPAQAAPVIIDPQAAPVIIDPQAAPAIIEPQDAQAVPAVIIVASPAAESGIVLPNILDLSAAPAVVVPLPTGVIESGAAAGALVVQDAAVEPSVTRISLVVTELPAAPLPVEPTIPPEIGNATPVPTAAATATASGRTRITDRWSPYWPFILVGFLVILGLLWFFARRSKNRK